LRMMGNTFFKLRKVSAQEVIFLILGFPLRFTSRSVAFINTNFPENRLVLIKTKQELRSVPENSTDTYKRNALIVHYETRPQQLEHKPPVHNWKCLSFHLSPLITCTRIRPSGPPTTTLLSSLQTTFAHWSVVHSACCWAHAFRALRCMRLRRALLILRLLWISRDLSTRMTVCLETMYPHSKKNSRAKAALEPLLLERARRLSQSSAARVILEGRPPTLGWVTPSSLATVCQTLRAVQLVRPILLSKSRAEACSRRTSLRASTR
jgi:hypothetical protein